MGILRNGDGIVCRIPAVNGISKLLFPIGTPQFVLQRVSNFAQSSALVQTRYNSASVTQQAIAV